MEHFFVSAGVAVAALFPIVDPIGLVPTFLALTRNMDEQGRRSVLLKALAAAVAMLVVFLFFGRFVLDFFEVSLAAVEFVGGLIIGYVGWQMVTEPESLEPEPHEEEGLHISPLAFPLLAGPGALAVTLGLSNRHDSWLDYPGFVFGIMVVCGLAYVILSHGQRVLGFLGPRGIDVLNRILGLFVLAIAVELIFNGIADHFGLEIVED